MPPSIEDIQQHLKDAINWHSDFVGCLREALAKVLAFEPYPGNGAAPEDEPLVTTRSISVRAEDSKSFHIPRRRGRPRKAKAGLKPARLPGRPKAAKARKARVKVTPELHATIRRLSGEGMSHRAIAEKLDLSVGTVANRLRKG